MKRLLIACLCLINSVGHAQSPSWDWARSGSNQNGSGRSVAKGLAGDKYGNVYTIGGYAGTVKFGADSFTAAGSTSIYLLKYSPSGTLLWVKAVENASSVVAQSVVVDNNSDIYIAGSFTGSAVFDTETLTSNGMNDAFLAKYGSDGSLKWAKSFGSVYEDFFQSGLALDSRNNILLSGTFATGIGSDATISFGRYTLTSKGRPNIYLVKFNSDGDAIWATRAGGEPDTYGYSLSTDKNDNIYIVGDFLGSQAHFDNITISSNNIGLVTGTVFLAKYDSSGAALWAQPFSGRRTVGGNDFGAIQGTLVTTDPDGNVLVGGSMFGCAIKVGSVVLEPISYYAGAYDIWFAKFSPAGNPIWAKKAGSTWTDYLRGLSTDYAGNVYITGEHGNVCVFDSDTAFIPMTGPALKHMFVCKYAQDGTLQWMNSIGGEYDAFGMSVIADKAGGVFVAGGMNAPSLSFGADTIHNGGTNNGFIAKMSASTSVRTPGKPQAEVKIYPNPASDQLIIQTNAPELLTGYALVDVFGRIVVQGRMTASPKRIIPLPSLPDGLYYLNLSGENFLLSEKVRIVH